MKNLNYSGEGKMFRNIFNRKKTKGVGKGGYTLTRT
jgi:hypothetical protein